MTLPEINKAIEQAAADAVARRAASLAADAAAAKAKEAYVASVQKIQGLHAEYQKVIKDILSFGGTVHVQF
jgi:hypothetical protein